MATVITDIGIGSLLLLLFSIVFKQQHTQKSELKLHKEDVEKKMVSNERFDGHKNLCGKEFDHIQADLKTLKDGQAKQNAVLSDIHDAVLLLKQDHDKRRRGDYGKDDGGS